MNFITLLFLAVGLSMDAFAVSICKGLSLKEANWKNASIVGLWFGGFQGLMPVIGFFLGVSFRDLIASFDHWIAFGLLVLIGANMIKEAVEDWKQRDRGDEVCGSHKPAGNPLGVKTMFTMAVATSIDALAVGLSFAMIDADIWISAAVIAVVTFLFSAAGVKMGSVFGHRYEAKAQLAGGVILILIGIKIIIEHLSGAA